MKNNFTIKNKFKIKTDKQRLAFFNMKIMPLVSNFESMKKSRCDIKIKYTYNEVAKILLILLIQLFLFTFLLSKASESIASGPNRAGINIGDHFSEAQSAINIVGPGGWIVIMAQPGDCATLSTIISANPDINFVIRGHYPGVTNLTNELADSWAYTLGNMDTGGKKVYFYPVNEPETADIIPVGTVKSYTTYLGNKLNELGLRGTKVIYLSPMFNRSHAGGSTLANWVNDLGGSSYFNQFDGITMNLYDFQVICNTPLCNSNPAENARDYQNTLSVMGVNKPVYAVESGVVIPGGVDYTDDRLKTFFEAAHSAWGGELKMAAVFSYDPEHEQPWSIYGTQTASLFSSLYPKCCGPEAETFDEEAFRENILQPLIDSGQVVQCDECGISAGGGDDYCSQSGSLSQSLSMCGLPKITMEPVTYRAQVIGIQTLDGNTPWRLKGRDLNNLAERPNSITDVFEIYVTSSDHVVQKPMVFRTLGNHNTIDEVLMRTPNYVPDTPAAIAFSIPYEAGIKIAGSFGKTARDSQKPGEKVSDFVKRLGWYQEETDEIGESPTMQAGPTKQNSSFRACIQKVGATTGFAFDVNGIIDITQPADRHSISVADNYVSSSLCSPGTNCENELYRFDINTGEIAFEDTSENTLAQDEKNFIDQIAYQYQNQMQTNQIDSNKSSQDNSSLSSIINPTDVNAITCAGANISILPQSSCLTGPCEVGYNLCAVPAGPPDHCNNHHIQITMTGSNGQSFYIATADETGFGHCYSPGMGSLQNFTGVDLIRDGPFTLTGKIWGGLLNDGVCNGPCSQEISVTCTLRIVNNKLESTCSQTPLPPPPPVNCLECSTWAGSACIKLIDPELPKSNECTSGLCKVTQDVTTMWSCLSACLPQPEPPDPPEPPGPEPRNPEEEPGPEPPDPPSCWQTIWNCIAGSEYMLMVAPKGFTGDYGNKTKDMTVNNNIVCIPGVNTGNLPAGVDDLCDEEPSKQNAKIEVKATAGNVTMIGETVKDTYVQFYDYTSQNERFCMRDSALTSPASSFPEDSQEMCDVFPLISSTTHSSGYPGASNPYGYGIGGGVNILYENNYFDPNLGAVTSIYDGGGRGRTNPLVDSLHVNYHWRAFQNSPNSISDFRLNELKNWVSANADAGKKSIFQIDWMSDRPNSGYEWGPDFTKESAYDPIVFSDGAKLLNYDNSNVKQQVRYLINELGREFNDDPRIESVIIMDERRPVNSSESLVGVTVNGRPVSKRIEGYNIKWGDAYGTQWINWNKFLVDTYKQAFPNKILIANIAGGPAGVRAELVDYLVQNNIAIKNSSMVADFNNRQANPVNGLTLNVIDAQRFTMDRLLQMGEHGHMCEIPQPAYSDAWKHPPQALHWEILSLLSFGGDQIQYFSGTDSSNHMLNPNSTVVNNAINFFKRYRNTTPSTTPSVWIALRGSEVGVEGNGATCPPTPFYPYNENYGWFMIQDDTPSDGKTKFWFSPWIPVIAIDAVNYDKYYRSTDSTAAVDGNGDPVSGKMYFKIAQGFYQNNGNNYTLKIRYKGMGTDTYKVVYRNSLGELVEKGPYTKVDNNEWFEEEVELDDVDFSPSIGFGGNSFYIDSNGDGEEYIGFVEVIPR